MAVDRLTPTSGTGPDFMAGVAEEVLALWNRVHNRLTITGGTANAIVATFAPSPIYTSFDIGMLISITPNSDNTGAATVAADAIPATEIVDADGVSLTPGILKAGRLTLLSYRSATNKLYIVGSASAGGINNYQQFIASGTWNKPAGASANGIAIIDIWGGGGGGGAVAGRRGGGGGGGFRRVIKRLSELGSSETVTIGAGGVIAGAGGTTSFGAHGSAYGGGFGNSNAGSGGGGGGGQHEVGANGTGTTGGRGGGPAFGLAGSSGTTGGDGGSAASGGGGGGGASGTGTSAWGGDGGNTIYGGGGGGGASGNAATGNPTSNGGRSMYGGGGGAGGSVNTPAGAGGVSDYGGNGGASGVTGSAPGGGGGANAPGARGEVRVTVIG